MLEDGGLFTPPSAHSTTRGDAPLVDIDVTTSARNPRDEDPVALVGAVDAMNSTFEEESMVARWGCRWCQS